MKSTSKKKARYWVQALHWDSAKLHHEISFGRFSEKLTREYLVYFKDSIKNLEGVLDE
jgi:hypothetical protein